MANNLTITGSFLGAKAARQATEKLTVRSFYLDITDNPQFPNTAEFQLKNDKCLLVDTLKKGEKIQVTFNINGREYTNPATQNRSIIMNLDAWKIESMTTQSVAARTAQPAPAPAPLPTSNMPAGAKAPVEPGADDLPF